MKRSKTYIATPPGETIKEQLQDRGMQQKEFAARMNFSEKHVSRLINGDVQLTPDMAVKLEMVLAVPAAFWNRLEAIYREKLAKVRDENTMETTIKKYKDPQGRTIEVISGIGGDTFFSAHHGHRIKSKFLPLRDTFQAAQDDLDAYAAKKRWIEVYLPS